jgi:putative membrane protein
MAESYSKDPRVYFAAERTFLAWIRTGLALMGFGFVVAKFGLFLREIAAAEPNLQVKSSAFSLWSGAALIVIGVVVNITAAVRHFRTIDELKRGDAVARPSLIAVAVAFALALIGASMVVYMFVTW